MRDRAESHLYLHFWQIKEDEVKARPAGHPQKKILKLIHCRINTLSHQHIKTLPH